MRRLCATATYRSRQRLERIEGAAALAVVEEREIGARDAVTVAQHDVACDRLEAGTEVLARLDQHVALAARIDARVCEHTEIRGLRAPPRGHDPPPAGVDHRGSAHT